MILEIMTDGAGQQIKSWSNTDFLNYISGFIWKVEFKFCLANDHLKWNLMVDFKFYYLPFEN